MPPPFRFMARRAGPLWVALSAYDVWRRLPPQHRRLLLASARKHGPRIASGAADKARTRLTSKRPPRP